VPEVQPEEEDAKCRDVHDGIEDIGRLDDERVAEDGAFHGQLARQVERLFYVP
jgi:hypothetical protein